MYSPCVAWDTAAALSVLPWNEPFNEIKTGIFPSSESSFDRAAASVTRSASCAQNTLSVNLIA